MTRVYVAAPYVDRFHVRLLHRAMPALGLAPTSKWAETDEDEFDMPQARLRELANENDRAIRMSDVVLVIARDGVGGEMFAEARYAISRLVPVYWVGRKILSAHRPGVLICETDAEALARMTHGDIPSLELSHRTRLVREEIARVQAQTDATSP